MFRHDVVRLMGVARKAVGENARGYYLGILTRTNNFVHGASQELGNVQCPSPILHLYHTAKSQSRPINFLLSYPIKSSQMAGRFP